MQNRQLAHRWFSIYAVQNLLLSCLISLTSGLALADAQRFTLGTLVDPLQVLPLKQYAGQPNALRMLLNPPILYLQSDGRIVCMLCKESPEVQLRREDKQTTAVQVVSLVLKKKLFWGDGKPLTREDVKYTLETMALAPYPQGQRPILPILRIEMDREQPNRMTLVLRHRRSDAAQLFAISLLPKHRSELIQALQKPTVTANEILTALKEPSFYYGSYSISEASSDSARLVVNKENEWDYAAKQELSVRFYSKLPDLAQALQKTEIDQTLNRELSWGAYQELRQLNPQLDQSYKPLLTPGHDLEVMIFNMHSPILVNPAIRLALFQSIDRKAINSQLYQNGGLPAEGLLHPDLLNRTGDKSLAILQKDHAAQLLDQAGWKLRDDGWRYGEKGERMSLVLSCTETRLQSGWHHLVAADLKLLGVELKTELIPETDYLRQTLAHHRFKDAACLRWNLPPLSPPIHLFHSLAIPDADNDYVGSNFSSWEQTGVNRILESMMREPDTGHLLRLFARLERHFSSDIPGVPLLYLPEVTLLRQSQSEASLQDLQGTLATYPAVGERAKARL